MTLFEMVQLLKKRLKFITLFTLTVTAVVAVYVSTLPDSYRSTADLYVYSPAASADDMSSVGIDLDKSEKLTNDLVKIATNESLAEKAKDRLKAGWDFEISAFKASSYSRIVTINVTGSNPKNVAEYTSVLSELVCEESTEVLNDAKVVVVGGVSKPDNPSGPNRMRYIAASLVIALLVSMLAILIVDAYFAEKSKGMTY